MDIGALIVQGGALSALVLVLVGLVIALRSGTLVPGTMLDRLIGAYKDELARRDADLAEYKSSTRDNTRSIAQIADSMETIERFIRAIPPPRVERDASAGTGAREGGV